mgnify:CR=1 FL=1
MVIHHLSLSGFRFFQRLEISFPSHINIIAGQNAQGKTSVLEAIHFLSLLTSPIAGHDREMINFNNLNETIPVGRVSADVPRKEKKHHIEARFILEKNGNGNARLRKEVLVDGAKRKLLDTVGYFNSVLFLPQMTRIIEDGPDERRKYLDRTLSQANPRYVHALSVFNQAIVRRNALLKQIAEQGGTTDQLVYWDELLAEHGALIISLRAQAVAEIHVGIQTRHSNLTDGQELFDLCYLPSLRLPGFENAAPEKQIGTISPLAGLAVEEIRSLYLDQLRLLRSEEVRRGVTTIGPHRDDLRFSANGVDLGIFGSRGQIRTAVMALKLAEVHWLEQKTGETPVLLLDETLAELDTQRRAYLLSYLEKTEQVILTTTDMNLFPPDFREKCERWQVVSGSVEKIANEE